MLDQQRDYVLRTVEERGVRLVRLWFTDVLGNLKSFAISPAELENALEDGMTFDVVLERAHTLRGRVVEGLAPGAVEPVTTTTLAPALMAFGFRADTGRSPSF